MKYVQNFFIIFGGLVMNFFHPICNLFFSLDILTNKFIIPFEMLAFCNTRWSILTSFISTLIFQTSICFAQSTKNSRKYPSRYFDELNEDIYSLINQLDQSENSQNSNADTSSLISFLNIDII